MSRFLSKLGRLMRTDLATPRSRLIWGWFWVVVLLVVLPCCAAVLVFNAYKTWHWSDIVWAAMAVLIVVIHVWSGGAYLHRRRQMRRRRQSWEEDRCYRCGYDLRGSESVTCPECGRYPGIRKHAPPRA